MGTTCLEFPERTAFDVARTLESAGIPVSYATERRLHIRNRDRNAAFALIHNAGQYYVEREFNYLPI